MPYLIQADEPDASDRLVTFDLRGTDGITPALAEAGGQPQVLVLPGGIWTDVGISVLVSNGNGRYNATLTQALIPTTGLRIQTRYKSAATAECPGDSFQVVAFDPNDLFAVAPAEASGRPSRLDGMIRRVWEWAGNKRTRDRSTGTVLLRNAADSATLETQTQATAGSVDSQTKGV